MPGYRTHLAGAAALTTGALYALNRHQVLDLSPGLAAGLMAVSLLATLFPDTDTASKARPYFYGLMALTDLVLLVLGEYQWAAVLGLFAMLPAVGNHRGWTHRWRAALLAPLPLVVVPGLLARGGPAAIHVASDLLDVDMLTGGSFLRESADLLSPWTPLLPFYGAAVLGYGAHLLLDRKA